MKDILMFMTSWCPHCKRATQAIEQLRRENQAYRDVEITMIDEEKEKKYADTFDYYLVPTFYVDGVKVHEGAAGIETIRKVFDSAVK